MSASVASVAPGAGVRGRAGSAILFLARYGILRRPRAVVRHWRRDLWPLPNDNQLPQHRPVGRLHRVRGDRDGLRRDRRRPDRPLDRRCDGRRWPARPGASAGGRRRLGDPDRDRDRLLRRAGERSGHRVPQSEPRPGHLRGSDHHSRYLPGVCRHRLHLRPQGRRVQLARQRDYRSCAAGAADPGGRNAGRVRHTAPLHFRPPCVRDWRRVPGQPSRRYPRAAHRDDDLRNFRRARCRCWSAHGNGPRQRTGNARRGLCVQRHHRGSDRRHEPIRGRGHDRARACRRPSGGCAGRRADPGGRVDQRPGDRARGDHHRRRSARRRVLRRVRTR